MERLPRSGEGPSKAEREAGFFKLRMYATLEGDEYPESQAAADQCYPNQSSSPNHGAFLHVVVGFSASGYEARRAENMIPHRGFSHTEPPKKLSTRRGDR